MCLICVLFAFCEIKFTTASGRPSLNDALGKKQGRTRVANRVVVSETSLPIRVSDVTPGPNNSLSEPIDAW